MVCSNNDNKSDCVQPVTVLSTVRYKSYSGHFGLLSNLFVRLHRRSPTMKNYTNDDDLRSLNDNTAFGAWHPKHARKNRQGQTEDTVSRGTRRTRDDAHVRQTNGGRQWGAVQRREVRQCSVEGCASVHTAVQCAGVCTELCGCVVCQGCAAVCTGCAVCRGGQMWRAAQECAVHPDVQPSTRLCCVQGRAEQAIPR